MIIVVDNNSNAIIMVGGKIKKKFNLNLFRTQRTNIYFQCNNIGTIFYFNLRKPYYEDYYLEWKEKIIWLLKQDEGLWEIMSL